MAIRWNSQLKAEVRRTVKSFNAKIRRLQNKGVTAALLPDMISSREIQKGITNRKELERRLAQLRDFTSAGMVERSEGGVMGTNELFIYRVGEANKAIKAIQDEYDRLDQINTRYPMMKSEYQANLESKMEYLARDIRKLSVKQVQIFNKNLLTSEQKTIRDEQFYQNFNKMIFFNAYKANLPPSLVARIAGNIDKFSPSELLEMYATEPTFRTVKETYEMGKHEGQEKSDEEVQEQYEALAERIEEKLSSK
jgi:uncharacterized small protein (DUF1192 family)